MTQLLCFRKASVYCSSCQNAPDPCVSKLNYAETKGCAAQELYCISLISLSLSGLAIGVFKQLMGPSTLIIH